MPSLARADDLPEREAPRIAYRGAQGCPDENVFIEQVRARTPRAVLAHEGESAAFVVTVSAGESESSGQVERTDAEGTNVVRRVTGKTCDEVVSAAALITALGLEARLAPPDAGPAQTRDPSDTVPDAVDVPTAAPPASSPWSAGAAFGIDSWSAPGGAWTASVFAELGSRAPFRYVRLRLRGASGAAAKDLRRASFLLAAGGLALCPMAVELATRVELAPCVGVELGNLNGRGVESAALPNPRSADIFWAAGYAALRIRWRIAQALSLELAGEIAFPLVRHDFTFQAPPDVIYALPAIGAGGAAGPVVHFP
jgi:hypothetical protein